tara:strand:- start:9699 stop:10706 length:1008 start_codon:yes stop_codon:yes gene_type:complete
MGDTDKMKPMLSASRMKTVEACSWVYWCKYHLNLPQTTNDGAIRGSICHLIFELLLEKKHKKHFNIIKKAGRIDASKAIERLVNKHLNHYQTNNEENYEMINDMVLVGLNNDFFCKGAKLLDPEYEFILENKDPEYVVRGFIDKAAKYIKDKKIIITDYKSSKQKFSGDDLSANLQAMIYSLVALKTWPKLKPIIHFCFLRFPSEPIQQLEFSEEELSGLEHYLSHVYKIINEFDEKSATTNFAADQPYPAKGEGFKGALNCGYAKYKGQLKKDGSLMWHCPYKFDFEYYELLDKDGHQLKTAFTKKELKAKKGQKIIKKKYEGCPRHTNNDFGF